MTDQTTRSRPAARSRRVPVRRLLAVGVGVGAAVTTAAVANASANGDGFYGPLAQATTAQPHAQTAAPSWSAAPMNDDALRGIVCPDAAHRSRDINGKAMDSRTMTDRTHWSKVVLRVTTVVDPADPSFDQLLGINDSGVAVGYRGSGADATHPNHGIAAWAPYGPQNVVDHDVPGAAQTQTVGLNGRSVVVGFSVDRNGVTSGFVRAGEHYRTVHHPRTSAHPAVDQLLGINNRGVAAGHYNDPAGNSHAYLYDVCSGHFRDVHLPVHADSVQATGINDDGTVTGFYTRGKTTRGFVLGHGRFVPLSFGSGTGTQALGIDKVGDVVGSYTDSHDQMHGYVWWHGHMRTLDVPQSTGTVINGVNDHGQLAGYYTTSDHRTIAFVAS